MFITFYKFYATVADTVTDVQKYRVFDYRDVKVYVSLTAKVSDEISVSLRPKKLFFREKLVVSGVYA